jgi:prepilin-type N-terminal cleavage/methylation domain-containing protein
MKKNGFTIVELAIVLVIIGIILAMAVKGKSMVDAARVKSDLAKIYKVEAAANIYFAKTGRPPVYGPMDPNNTALVDMGAITIQDLTLDTLYMEHPSEGLLNRIYIVACLPDFYPDGSGEIGWAWNYLVGVSGSPRETFNACILVGTQDAHDPFEATVKAGSTHFFVCHVETTLDDEYDRTGQGRQAVNIAAGSLQIRLMDFSDCDSLRNTTDREIWFYKIL